MILPRATSNADKLLASQPTACEAVLNIHEITLPIIPGNAARAFSPSLANHLPIVCNCFLIQSLILGGLGLGLG